MSAYCIQLEDGERDLRFETKPAAMDEVEPGPLSKLDQPGNK